MPESITAARLDEIIAAFNNHDADAVISFFAPEGVMLSPAGKEAVGTTLRGRDTIRAALAKRFADSLIFSGPKERIGFLAIRH